MLPPCLLPAVTFQCYFISLSVFSSFCDLFHLLHCSVSASLFFYLHPFKHLSLFPPLCLDLPSSLSSVEISASLCVLYSLYICPFSTVFSTKMCKFGNAKAGVLSRCLWCLLIDLLIKRNADGKVCKIRNHKSNNYRRQNYQTN